jgi:hypothetical protein
MSPPSFARRRSFLLGGVAAAGSFVLFRASPVRAEAPGPKGGTAPTGGEAAAATPAVCEVLGVSIANNHGHELLVSVADIVAGKPKTYDIAGSSGHSHEVTLTADDFAAIAGGKDLRIASTPVSNHRHTVRVRCESAAAVKARENVCDTLVPGKDNHELIVTAADMEAAQEKTFDIQGISLHTHALTLREEDFRALKARKAVRRYCSAADDHTHLVVIRYQKK